MTRRSPARRFVLRICITPLVVGIATTLASVSFDLQVELLNRFLGMGNPSPQSTLVVLVADTAKNGFGDLQAGATLSLNDFWAGDDKILFKTNLTGYSTDGVLNTVTPALTLDNTSPDATLGSWSPGDPVAIFWFPTLTLASNQLIGGESYGKLTLGTAAAGSIPASEPFITPDDGKGGHRLYHFSNEPGANNLYGVNGSGASTIANEIVVPEPSSAGMFVVGAFLLQSVRRRSSGSGRRRSP